MVSKYNHKFLCKRKKVGDLVPDREQAVNGAEWREADFDDGGRGHDSRNAAVQVAKPRK